MKPASIRNLTAAALVFCTTGQIHAEEPLAYTNEMAPGVYSFGGGNGYHSMFLVTDEGVVAFETVNSAHSEAMIEAIRGVTDQPIRYALHTHNHWDHASGGAVFQAAGAETVMHSLAAAYVAANPGQDTSPPDIVWEGERQFIGDLRDAIFAEFQNGTPSDQIPGTVALPQYAEWSGYDEWLEMNAWRVMLDIWMGPYPWFPEG